MKAVLLAALWAMPIVPFAVAGRTLDGVGIAIDLVAVLLLLALPHGRFATPAAVAAGAVWALAVTYALALAGSRLATDEHLPLYDLLLLVRPLVVVGSDLYGSGVYAMALAAGFVPFLLWGAAAWAFRRLTVASPWPVRGMALALCLLPGSRLLLVPFAQDVARSSRLAGDFAAERRARPHDDLQALSLAVRPDVHVYVVESYGDVIRHLTPGRRWEMTLRLLDRQAKAQGWHTASGISEAPVHGGRSWIADASVLTGLYVANQSNYERVTAMASRIPTLPNFFRDRGYRTILVRPSDRVRPGVQLQNRYGFQDTIFFDDIDYVGPAMGWGHIPDQFTLHVAHRDVIDPVEGPTFAFFHLATAHLPWNLDPRVVDDPMSLQDQEGERAAILKVREPHQELRMQLKRFVRDEADKEGDRMGQQEAYGAAVMYDLEAIVRQVGAVSPERPRLVVFYGDHQPAFLARGEPSNVPMHVMASDPALLQPFLDAGFRDGLMPEYPTPVIAHRDVFPLVARAAAALR